MRSLRTNLFLLAVAAEAEAHSPLPSLAGQQGTMLAITETHLPDFPALLPTTIFQAMALASLLPFKAFSTVKANAPVVGSNVFPTSRF